MLTSSNSSPTRVLVPFDASPSSEFGVRHVLSELVKNPALEIHILNVQRPFSRYVSRFTGRRARTEFHREQSEIALKPACRTLDKAGVSYTLHTDTGDTAECIAGTAQRLGCDRIVMGTARKSPLIRWVEDSVTNRVIQRTTVPVEFISGNEASGFERVGIPAGVGAGLLVLWLAAE